MSTLGVVIWYTKEREREAAQLAENWRLFQELKNTEASLNPGRSAWWLVFLRALLPGLRRKHLQSPPPLEQRSMSHANPKIAQ